MYNRNGIQADTAEEYVVALIKKSLFIKQDKIDKIMAGINNKSFDQAKLEQIIGILESSLDKQHTVVKQLVRDKPWALKGLHQYVYKEKMEVLHEDEAIETAKEALILAEIEQELASI